MLLLPPFLVSLSALHLPSRPRAVQAQARLERERPQQEEERKEMPQSQPRQEAIIRFL